MKSEFKTLSGFVIGLIAVVSLEGAALQNKSGTNLQAAPAAPADGLPCPTERTAVRRAEREAALRNAELDACLERNGIHGNACDDLEVAAAMANQASNAAMKALIACLQPRRDLADVIETD